MKTLCLTVAFAAWVSMAWATDRYVDATTSGCSTPSDTDFNPATESCGSGSELVYNSITAAVSAHASGDNIYVLAGTYAQSFSNTLKSGVSSSQPTKLWAYNGQTVTIQTPVGATNGDAFRITSKNDINIKQLIVDNTNVVAPNGKRGFAFRIDGTIAVPSNRITLDGVTGRNAGIGMFTAHVNFLHVTQSHFHNNGHDEFDHGIYTDNGTNDAIIENSEFDHNAQMGAQLYKFPSRMIFRRNYVHDNCAITHSGSSVYLSGVDNLLDRNVIWSNGDCTTGITISTGSSTAPTGNKLRHNSVFCSTGTCTNGLNVPNASVTNTRLENNIALGHANNIRNIGTGTVLTDNVTAGTSTDYWTDPAAGDFTLKVGSSAIDGGTNIGLSYNGPGPDQGAHEVPVFSACEVRAAATSAVRVTFTNNLRPPMLPASGVTGVTFRKNGASNAVLSSTRVGDNQYDFTVTNSYVGGDTVDVSIVPASTNLTDSALIGSTNNQPFVSTLTNTACTNNASGASAAVLTQTKFRVHGLYGAEDSPIVKAATNANYSVVPGGAHRLRIKIDGTIADPEPTGFQLRVSHNGGAYVALTDAYVNHVKMYAATHVDIPDGATTTEQLPSDHATNVTGSVVSYAHAVPNVDLSQDSEAELEYVLQYEDTAVVGDTYDYRLYTNAGDALTAYTVTPRITIKQSQATGGY